MTIEKTELAMRKYSKQVPKSEVEYLRKCMTEAPDDCFDGLMSMRIKGRIKTLILSNISFSIVDWLYFMPIQLNGLKTYTTLAILLVCLGGISLDRFLLGDLGVGMAKILFCGWALFARYFSENVPLGIIMCHVAIIWCLYDIYAMVKKAQLINGEILTDYLLKQISA